MVLGCNYVLILWYYKNFNAQKFVETLCILLNEILSSILFELSVYGAQVDMMCVCNIII